MKTMSAAVVMAVTIGQLAGGRQGGWSPEQEMVLAALRRSTGELEHASDAELGEYISKLSEEQLRGVVSNVKGQFHELLLERDENLDGDAVNAALFELTNHPGADLQFMMDGEVVDEVQVKAVQDPAAIFEHFQKYPEIDVIATSEVVSQLGGVFGDQVRDGGYLNSDLGRITEEALDDLPDGALEEILQEGLLTSALVIGAMQSRAILSGQTIDKHQMKSYLQLLGIGGVTAAAVDAALGVFS